MVSTNHSIVRKTYERILVPLDGSELAEKALDYARIPARSMKGKIILFHACESYALPRNLIKVYLDKKAEELQVLGIEAAPVITYGDAADDILVFSEKHDIDLIVMSTHGHSGMSRWAVGNTSNKVMQESYVPLLLIKTGVIPSTFRTDEGWRILVPLDGSELSEASLSYVAGMIDGPGGEIILLQVNEAMDAASYLDTERVPSLGMCVKRADPEIQRSIQSYLLRISRYLQSQGLSVCSEVVSGRAAREIIKYAESHDISLIAMTTHGRSGFSHWPYGSVAYKVIHGTSRPLLLLRQPPTVLYPSL